ncbi:phage virion morphogenesis protein [Caloranaerobacter sp. DY30410]|uniref:phage virion morphogenesis protein n=1 Tax=Caloranaerobacter sp. DY30410 TaxID=3238305 RepID=UPI003D0682C8
MPGIRLEGDINELRNTLRNLSNFNYLGLNQAIGDALVSSTQLRFRQEKDPKGRKWKKSIRAESEGGQTLSKSTDLKNSINSRATEEGVVVGTNKKYARIHQYGGEIRAKNKKVLRFKVNGRWISKKKVKIPKREFLGISNSDLIEIKEIIEEKIREHVER